MNKLLLLSIVVLFSISASAQKKKDITNIESLIQQGKVDSAVTLLEPYIQKFPDVQEAHLYLGMIYYKRAQGKFLAYQEKKDNDCYLLSADYEKAKSWIAQIANDYSNAISEFRKGQYPNLNISTISFNWMHTGYYFNDPNFTGYEWKDFGMKKVIFEMTSEEKVWDYGTWCIGWNNVMDYWIPKIQDNLANYNQTMEMNKYCSECTESNFNNDAFKQKNPTFFMMDKNPLAAYLLWYKCFKRTYQNRIKDLYSDKPQEKLSFINKADSVLKICEGLNEEKQFEKYKIFFEKSFNGKEGVQKYISDERIFIDSEKKSVDESAKKKDDTEKVLKDMALDEWAKYNNNLVPLFPIGITDFSATTSFTEKLIDLPTDLGDYENRKPNQMVTYRGFNTTNYCTNYITSFLVTPDGKLYKYATGAVVNKTRYKKDADAFVVRITVREKDLEKKVAWLKTFDNENENGHTNDYGTTLFPTKDGGCLVTFIVSDERANIILKLDKDGNEVWRKKWTIPNNSYTKFPESIFEDKDRNVVACFGNNDEQFVTTNDFYILKLNGYNGNTLWEKKLSKDFKISLYDNLFGGFIEVPNQGYMLLLNFVSVTNASGTTFRSRASNYNSPFNVAALKIDYSGNSLSVFPFLSDEPRYVNTCELTKENTVMCSGRRGNYDVSWGMNYHLRERLQSNWPDTGDNNRFFMEIDPNGNIIKTNGVK